MTPNRKGLYRIRMGIYWMKTLVVRLIGISAIYSLFDIHELCQCQIQIMSNINRSVSQFSYSYSPQSQIHEGHPQHRYFKLYDKYTSSQTSNPTFCFKKSSKDLSRINDTYDDSASRIRELQVENQLLRQELSQQKDQIVRLRYELYYCNEQLNQITCVEAHQYQKAINELRIEIESMVQKDKLAQSQLNQLKAIQSNNAYNKTTRQQNKEYNIAQRNMGKENQHNCLNECKQDRGEDQTNRHFLAGLKDMHAKINGYDVKSLKQLWKWIKGMGQSLGRLRKWSRKCRQFKNSMILNSTNTVQLLDEAMIIIN